MIKGSNIFISGGMGFIGSHIAERLCQDNKVVIVDDLSSGFKKNIEAFKDKVTFIEADIYDKDLLNVLMGKYQFDYVFHLAAHVGNVVSLENPILDMNVNVGGTIALLEACRKHRIQKFVYSSSSAVYGDARTLPIKEDAPKLPESPYACSKYAAEQYALAYGRIYNVPVIALRYFNVYGTRQGSSEYANAIPVFFRNMKEGKVTIFGDGEQTRDFVNVREVVEANILAAESDLKTGVFNIASGSSISVNELVKIIEVITKANPEIVYTDRRKGEVLHSLADISLAKRWLGYEPKVKIGLGLGEYYGVVQNDA